MLTNVPFNKFASYFNEVDSLLLNVKLKEHCTPEMYILIIDMMKSRPLQKEIAWYLAYLLIYSVFPSVQGNVFLKN